MMSDNYNAGKRVWYINLTSRMKRFFLLISSFVAEILCALTIGHQKGGNVLLQSNATD